MVRAGGMPRSSRLSRTPSETPMNRAVPACQPTSLKSSPRGIAFARVVLDVHQGAHAGQQPGAASPDVVAEAMRYQDVRPPAQAQARQRPDRGEVAPARDQDDLEPCGAQRGDARHVGPALDTQREHDRVAVAAAVGLPGEGEVHRDLGGARKPAGDEVDESHVAALSSVSFSSARQQANVLVSRSNVW